jgi:hypothetical protein
VTSNGGGWEQLGWRCGTNQWSKRVGGEKRGCEPKIGLKLLIKELDHWKTCLLCYLLNDIADERVDRLDC